MFDDCTLPIVNVPSRSTINQFVTRVLSRFMAPNLTVAWRVDSQKESLSDVRLHSAARTGDLMALRHLLDSGKVHPDCRDKVKTSLPHCPNTRLSAPSDLLIELSDSRSGLLHASPHFVYTHKRP